MQPLRFALIKSILTILFLIYCFVTSPRLFPGSHQHQVGSGQSKVATKTFPPMLITPFKYDPPPILYPSTPPYYFFIPSFINPTYRFI